MSVVLLLFVWFVFVDHFGVCDLFMAAGWDILIADDMEGLSAFDPLLLVGGILFNALAETAKFSS